MTYEDHFGGQILLRENLCFQGKDRSPSMTFKKSPFDEGQQRTGTAERHRGMFCTTALLFVTIAVPLPTSPAPPGVGAPPSKGEFCFAGPIRYYASKGFEIERGCHTEKWNLLQSGSCASHISIQMAMMSSTSFKLRLISRSPKRRKRTPNDSSRACRSWSASP